MPAIAAKIVLWLRLVNRAAPASESPQTLLASNRGHLKLAPTTQAISYPGAVFYQIDGQAARAR